MQDKAQRELYRIVGQRIKRAREDETFLTQEGLAENIGLSRASVVNIEKGRQRAPLHILWDIAVELEVDVSDLLPSQELLNKASSLDSDNLDPEIIRYIERKADGNPETIDHLMEFIELVKSSN